MHRILKSALFQQNRTFKNFGHKRHPEATITILWQGFLTFTFIGMGIEWKRIYRFFFTDEPDPEKKSLLD